MSALFEAASTAVSTTMSTAKRKSTVHDLTSLRLHPDGSRVGTSDSKTRPRSADYVVQDLRGNWIAKDAAGLGAVRQRRSRRLQSIDADDIGGRDGEDDNPPRIPYEVKGKGKAVDDSNAANGELARKDPRATKRRLFAEDLSFLRSTPSPVVTVDEAFIARPKPQPPQPEPSSDLLKCIHYFASTYYSETGQLHDASRTFRREKKRRKLEQLKQTASGAGSSRDSAARESLRTSNVPPSSPQETIGLHQVRGSDAVEVPCQEKPETKRPLNILTGTDMYKVFDGSALMAIGMLLQEYVSELVSPRIPEGWEEEMLRTEELESESRLRKRSGGRHQRGGRRDSDLDNEDVAQTTDDEVQPSGRRTNVLEDGVEPEEELVPP